eukprot:5910449-Alexandrium_andersonii.AAC.1
MPFCEAQLMTSGRCRKLEGRPMDMQGTGRSSVEAQVVSPGRCMRPTRDRACPVRARVPPATCLLASRLVAEEVLT